MQYSYNKRKLPLILLAFGSALILSGCSSDSVGTDSDRPSPTNLMFSEVLAKANSLSGERIMFAGKIGIGESGAYRIFDNSESSAGEPGSTEYVELDFAYQPPSPIEMERCAGKLVLVVGYMQDNQRVLVEQMHLEADVSSNKYQPCYDLQ